MEHYRQYVAALWGMVQGKAITADAQARYADAVNTLTLVAPPSVLRALYAFQDEISYRNTQRSDERHDQLVNVLLRQMRRDVRPRSEAAMAPSRLSGFYLCRRYGCQRSGAPNIIDEIRLQGGYMSEYRCGIVCRC
ncbi:hypothetical protein MMB19_13800 [Ralstonia insidiosa]|nr:hypothetical protein MMB19_13800 [Ralstonia insidiosa]